MHYYQFHISDYRKDTNHLSLLEHAIYRALLDTYYLEESPLCADDAKLMRTHSVRSANEEDAYKNVISDFFEERDGFYHHSKCDEQLSKLYEKSEKARNSAKKRWEKKANAMRTHSERNANGMLPNNPITQYPIPNTKENKKASPSVKPEVKQVFDYWVKVMNKKNPKLTAKREKNLIARLKEGYTVEQLKDAISGCLKSPYHMGKNENSTVYDDIELITRSGEKVETFIEKLNQIEIPMVAENERYKPTPTELAEQESAYLFAQLSTDQESRGAMGQNDPALQAQVGVVGRGEIEGWRTNE